MKNEIAKWSAGEIILQIAKWLIEAGVMLWVCTILLPVCPWIAALAGLTYWDWVGLLWGVRILIGNLRLILHK